MINFHGLFCNAQRCRILVPLRYQKSAPQSITEKPMEYYLDEWFVMTPYVAGLFHPAMFSYSITIILLKEVWK